MTWEERVGGLAIMRPTPAATTSAATISSVSWVPIRIATIVAAAGPAMNTTSVNTASRLKALRRRVAGTITDRLVRTIVHTGMENNPPRNAKATSSS